jgi:hypothetical protein
MLATSLQSNEADVAADLLQSEIRAIITYSNY